MARLSKEEVQSMKSYMRDAALSAVEVVESRFSYNLIEADAKKSLGIAHLEEELIELLDQKQDLAGKINEVSKKICIALGVRFYPGKDVLEQLVDVEPDDSFGSTELNRRIKRAVEEKAPEIKLIEEARDKALADFTMGKDIVEQQKVYRKFLEDLERLSVQNKEEEMKRIKLFGIVGIVVVFLMAYGCASTMVGKSYQALYSFGTAYNAVMSYVGEEYKKGRVTVEERNKVIDLANPVYGAYHTAVSALESYKSYQVLGNEGGTQSALDTLSFALDEFLKKREELTNYLRHLKLFSQAQALESDESYQIDYSRCGG